MRFFVEANTIFSNFVGFLEETAFRKSLILIEEKK